MLNLRSSNRNWTVRTTTDEYEKKMHFQNQLWKFIVKRVKHKSLNQTVQYTLQVASKCILIRKHLNDEVATRSKQQQEQSLSFRTIYNLSHITFGNAN